MKRFYVLIALIAFLTTGCATSKSTVDSSIESLAKDLAQASLNNDNDLMVELGNKLMAKNAIPKKITIEGDCHIAFYSVNGVEHSAKVCK